jgi:hypothetical protein
MPDQSSLAYERLFLHIIHRMADLLRHANARLILIIDRTTGQLVAQYGNQAIREPKRLAQATLKCLAASQELSDLLGDNPLALLFHDDHRDMIHLTVINERLSLLIVSEKHLSIGLSKIRTENAAKDFRQIFHHIQQMAERDMEQLNQNVSFTETSDEDIDNLFDV